MTEHSKHRLLIACIGLSLLPSIALLSFPSVPTLSTVTLWGSAVCGYMGITLLLWMYLLGAKSIMSIAFSDLAPVLSIHKWLGKYGTLAIFLHPLLVTISYGETWLYSVIPHAAALTERHILLGQIALWLIVVVWITSALVRDKLSWRTWRYLHWLSYVAIPFALLHVPDLGSQLQTHMVVKAYFAVLCLLFFVASFLRLRGFLNLDRSRYTVVRTAELTPVDGLIKLRPTSAAWLRPNPGQYVYIKLGFISEDHPFSVTQFDQTTGEITLAFRRAGMFTGELEKLTDGQDVYLSGPYGSFTELIDHHPDTPVVYISGGIGITPFVDRIMSENTGREQWLFAANRNRDLAVLYAPLQKKLGDHAVAIYSDQPGPLGINEEAGYITPEVLGKYLSDPTRYTYYICGPSPMITLARQTLAQLGVAPERVHSEKFGW